jgi:uncharacterized protein (DUF1778 family)
MNAQQITLSNQSIKRERLEVRVPKKLKLLIQHAAAIQGRSLSDFLITTVEKAASDVIRENQVIQLSVQDSQAFAMALLNPPKPNKKLKSAYTSYKEAVSSK